MGIPAIPKAHSLMCDSSVDRYTSVDDLFECPSIEDIVVTATPFDSILEATE
jgi:hypothetical protein